ncbi:MAG TPA: dienelactone hydrolase family protein [Myxococcota bacterium]|nr:dienelactone hydrolase family protein [Myxococcota bacterium]
MVGGVAEEVRIPPVMVGGLLAVPADARAAVVFAHGSGSSRRSPRNQRVAAALFERGFATLLLDLLTEREGASRANVFDVDLLADRLAAAANWLAREGRLRTKPFGFFGASTGAAAALVAASRVDCAPSAIVSRGGRPDLAGVALGRVRAPTLLIVGSRDLAVLDWNRDALARLDCTKELVVVDGATHLFEEPAALERVCDVAGDWFERHLDGAEERPDVRRPQRRR